MRANHRLPIVISCAAGAGMCTTVLVFYPGIMSWDSIVQFQQASTRVISGDFHPPIMAYVWHYIHQLIPGPFGMMLLHNLMFWTGLALIAFACRLGTLGATICILGIGFFPPVFGLLGILWKDVGMGAALTLSIGMMLVGARESSILLVALSILPLFYALSVRPNAPAAIIPFAVLVFWSADTALGTQLLKLRAYVCLSLILTLTLFVTSRAMNRAIVTSMPPDVPETALQFSMLHDLEGISVRIGQVRFPVYVRRTRPEITMGALHRMYDPADVNRFVFNDYWETNSFNTWNRNEFDELVRYWWESVTTYPTAYLGHRSQVLATMFQIRGIHYPFQEGFANNDLGLHFQPTLFYLYVVAFLNRTKEVFFRGWVFLGIALTIMSYGWFRGRWISATVCASGVLYVLPYVVVSCGSDFRFIWWLVVSTLISVPLLVGETAAPFVPKYVKTGDSLRGESPGKIHN